MKHTYACILVLTIIIGSLFLLASCDGGQTEQTQAQSYSVSFYVNGEVFSTLEVQSGQKAAVPTEPVREGYFFNGWFLDENVWTNLFTAESLVTSDVAVYAKFTPVKYPITYVTEKDVKTTNPSEYTVEQHLELNPAVKEHYDFVGWFTDADLTLPFYEIPMGMTGELALYPKFEPTQYKAVFMDGETVVAEVPYTIENKKIEIPEVPEHAGYVGEWEEFQLVPGGVTVNAVYTAVDYRIVYEGVVSSEHKNPTGYNADQQPITLKQATREHYTFVGWFFDQELTEPATEIAQGTTGDLTLYAKWEPVQYKAVFMDGETVVEILFYTVETESLTAPEIPEHKGYIGEWESYELVPGDITVNAVYAMVDYQIVYEGVDASEHDNQQGYNVEMLPVELNDAEREHYIFEGWYTDANYLNRIIEIAQGTTGDLTLYAKWTPVQYTATFMDGETVVDRVVFTVETESLVPPDVPVHAGYVGVWEDYELSPEDFTVNAVYALITYKITYENVKDVAHNLPEFYAVTSDTITLTNLSKPGYVFDGWYLNGRRVNEVPTGSTGNIVLTAAWTPIVYSLKFHFDPEWAEYANAGNPETYTVEDRIVFGGLTCKIPGYVFDGWYTAKNEGEGSRMTEVAQGTIGDIVLYARYVPKTYTITCVGVEGAIHINPATYTIETETFGILPAYREGYIFDGWYTDKGLTTPAEATVPKGSMGDIVLYAKWTPITYPIEYEGFGGTLPENPATYDTTQTLILLAPTKDGYVFKGWFTEAEGGEQVLQILPGTTGALKLYARWEIVYYSIHYYLYGGENALMNYPLYTIETAVFLLSPSKPGYAFDGWYADPGFNKQVSMIPAGSHGDVTLYAKWKLVENKVTYVLPNGAEHDNVPSYTVEDQKWTLNPATLTGYTFAGWYKDAEYTQQITQLPSAGVYGDLTLYAKFVPNKYHIWLGSTETTSHTVTFYPNGGEGESFAQTVTMDQGLVFPELPVRKGYLFAGWYDNAECLGKVFDLSAPVVADVELYAKWVAYEYFIQTNAPIKVTLNGSTAQRFTFVSLTDSVITITTEGTLDTCGKLYDAAGNLLISSDDASAYDKNFRIIYHATAGEEYTVEVAGYSDAVIGDVILNVQGHATVAAGGTAYLPNMRVVGRDEMYSLPVPEARYLYKFLGWADENGVLYTDAQGRSLKPWQDDADAVLYELWEEMYYDVVFDSNGGSAVESFKLYTYEQLDVTEIIPVRKGYRFLGWTLNGAPFTQGIMPDHSIELVAEWEEIIYTVTYENTKDATNANATYYTVTDKTITLVDLSKPGYVFDGWYANDQRVTEIPTGSTGDIVLTAEWTPVVYTITFMDGDTVVELVYFTVETENLVAPEVPAHLGYAGVWERFVPRLADFTVKAVYTPIPYTLTYEGVLSTEHSNPAGYDATQWPMALSDAEREHYIFEGWYTDAEYTNRVTEIASGTVGNLTLYAKWTPVVYTITFMDGETVVAEIPYTVETESITEPEVPLHKGYTGKWEAYELTPGGITVEAVYTLIIYSIKYENVKDVEHSNPDTYTVIDETVILADLSKDGYVFDGWYANGERVTEIPTGSTGDIILTAEWTLIVYSIKLHFNPAEGAYADLTNPETYTVEDSFVLADLMCTIPGYAFTGWYTAKGADNGTLRTEIVEGTCGDIDFYARFAPETYTITYVGAEAAVHMNVSTYTVNSATFGILPAYREGFVFDGWFTDPTLTLPASLTVYKGSTGDMVLYAKWTPITYTITYDGQGGVLPVNPATYNATQTLTLTAPTKPGYVFLGWYTTPVDPEEGQEGPKGVLVSEIAPGDWTEDLVLYARWKPAYYYIHYYLYGGENSPKNYTLYTADKAFVLYDPSKRGYVFEGWYTDPDYRQSITEIAEGSYGDLELYAKWSLIEYQVMYIPADTYLNDVIHSNKSVYTVEDGLSPLKPATMDGYSFVGWYLEPECTQIVTDLSEIVGENHTVVLYAKFEPKEYKIWLGTDDDNHSVVFDLNDGESETFEQTVTVEQALVYPDIPVREGYLFAGWYENAEGTGKAYDMSVPVMGDVYLYAKWVACESSVQINVPVTVKLSGTTENRYTFVSLVDTSVVITTVGELDTYGILYDAKGNVLAKNDDASDTNKNCRIEYQVLAGEAYTVAIYGFSDATVGDVTLQVAGNTTVAAGGKAYLSNCYVVKTGEHYRLPVPEGYEHYVFLGWVGQVGDQWKRLAKGDGNSETEWNIDSDIVVYERWAQYP